MKISTLLPHLVTDLRVALFTMLICVRMEIENVWSFVTTKKYKYQVVSSIWEYWNDARRLVLQPKLKARTHYYHDFSVSAADWPTSKAWITRRAQGLNVQWEKQFNSGISLCAIAPLGDRGVEVAVERGYCLVLDAPMGVAARAKDLADALAREQDDLHSRYKKRFGSISCGRRDASRMEVSHISCAQVYVVSFGGVPQGFFTYEALIKNSMHETFHNAMEMITENKNFKYMVNNISS